VLALLFLVQYSFADYTVYTYYSSSGCSGSPSYYEASPSSDCRNVGCTEESSGVYYTTSCSSGIPSIPGGIVSLWEYSSSSDCSGNPSTIYGYSSKCNADPFGSGYGYATCSGTSITFYQCSSSYSYCTGCSGESFSTSCTSSEDGSSYKYQCATSSASFSTTSLSLVIIQVLTVFTAFKLY